MKLELDNDTQAYQINDYQAGQYIRINQQNYPHALILSDAPPKVWSVADFDSLNKDSFAPLLAYKPDVVILGTGAKMHFPDPKLYQHLIEHNIGLEAMSTAAACRTYTVLVSEQRRVVAALLL